MCTEIVTVVIINGHLCAVDYSIGFSYIMFYKFVLVQHIKDPPKLALN
jgi:hypothetical protein